MDAQEIKEKKKQLEIAIAGLLWNFETDTETSVEDLQIIKTEELHSSIGIITKVRQVSIKISL